MKKKQKVVKKKAVKKNKNNPLKLNQDEILLGMCIFLKKISENLEILSKSLVKENFDKTVKKVNIPEGDTEIEMPLEVIHS